MFPILISIGPLVLYTYGLFICLAIFFGLFVIWKRGIELNFEPKELFDAVFKVCMWIFVGSRIGYILTHFNDFGFNIFDWLNVVGRPGWYYPAGMIGGFIAIVRIAKKLKWDAFLLADLIVSGIVLAQAILALGAFFGGIGFGAPTQSFLGIQFSGVFDKRYPVQLWEVITFGACFWYLWWAEAVYRTFSWYKRNKSQAATGFLVSVYVIVWGLVKFIGGFFRSPEMVVAGIVRLDLLIPLLMTLVGVWLLLKRSGMIQKNIGRMFLEYFGMV